MAVRSHFWSWADWVRPMRMTVRVVGVMGSRMGMGMSKGVGGQVVRVLVVERFWGGLSGWKTDRSRREESGVDGDGGGVRGVQALIRARLKAMLMGTREGTPVGRRDTASVLRVNLMRRLSGCKTDWRTTGGS